MAKELVDMTDQYVKAMKELVPSWHLIGYMNLDDAPSAQYLVFGRPGLRGQVSAFRCHAGSEASQRHDVVALRAWATELDHAQSHKRQYMIMTDWLFQRNKIGPQDKKVVKISLSRQIREYVTTVDPWLKGNPNPDAVKVKNRVASLHKSALYRGDICKIEDATSRTPGLYEFRGHLYGVSLIAGTTKSGKVLTNQDIEALADEAEKGYDIERLLKKTKERVDVDVQARAEALVRNIYDTADVSAKSKYSPMLDELMATRDALEVRVAELNKVIESFMPEFYNKENE